jgi:hypothetical protein
MFLTDFQSPVVWLNCPAFAMPPTASKFQAQVYFVAFCFLKGSEGLVGRLRGMFLTDFKLALELFLSNPMMGAFF